MLNAVSAAMHLLNIRKEDFFFMNTSVSSVTILSVSTMKDKRQRYQMLDTDPFAE